MATLRDVKRKIRQYQEHADDHQDHEDDLRVEAPARPGRAGKDHGLRGADGRAPEADREPRPGETPIPCLLEREEIKKVLLFPIASDRGLSGAFNLNVATAVERFVQENRARYERIGVYLVGRKIRDYLRRRRIETAKEWVDLKTVGPEVAGEMAARADGPLSER